MRSHGDLSINEKDKLMVEVQDQILGMKELDSIYTRTGGDDEIGQIQITPVDWQYRRPVKEIISDLRVQTKGIAGIELEFSTPNAGPPSEHDLVIELSARDGDQLNQSVTKVREWIDANPAFTNVSDTSNKQGIDWK